MNDLLAIAFAALLFLVFIPGFIFLMHRYPTLFGMKKDKFPAPPGHWHVAGNYVRLPDYSEFKCAHDNSPIRTINPTYTLLRAPTLWTKQDNNAKCYFFYGKANAFVHTPFHANPICIITGLNSCEYDLVISNRLVTRRIKRRKSRHPAALSLGKATYSHVCIEPDLDYPFINEIDSETRLLMRRFLLIEKFRDSLVLAGRHTLFYPNEDFFSDAEKLVEVFSDHHWDVSIFDNTSTIHS